LILIGRARRSIGRAQRSIGCMGRAARPTYNPGHVEIGSLRWLSTEVRRRPFDPSHLPWMVSQRPFDPYRAGAKVYRAGGWPAPQTTLVPRLVRYMSTNSHIHKTYATLKKTSFCTMGYVEIYIQRLFPDIEKGIWKILVFIIKNML
jgi:hypothetical protein